MGPASPGPWPSICSALRLCTQETAWTVRGSPDLEAFPVHLQGHETLSGLLRVPFGPRHGPLTRRVCARSLGMTPGPPTNLPAAPAHPDHCLRTRGSGAGPGAQPIRSRELQAAREMGPPGHTRRHAPRRDAAHRAELWPRSVGQAPETRAKQDHRREGRKEVTARHRLNSQHTAGWGESAGADQEREFDPRAQLVLTISECALFTARRG